MAMGIRSFGGFLAVLGLVLSAPAMAYVGPGAGLTLLSALWGLLAAVLAAVAFIVIWPIRRWRRRRQAALEAGGSEVEPAQARRQADRPGTVTDGNAR